MIIANKVRTLSLDRREVENGGRQFVSAASGLVGIKNRLYVVADDELHLGCFTLAHDEPGYLFRLFEGELPSEHKARKKLKPDLEALVHLNIANEADALLAIPSGSKKNRVRGSLISLCSNGLPQSSREINFKPLYDFLENEFSQLNIEGAVVHQNTLKLFQRGNGSLNENAIITLNLARVLSQIGTGILNSSVFEGAIRYDLGRQNEVAYSFTDATVQKNGDILFTAAAEDSPNTYEDGKTMGSAIGRISQDNKLGNMIPIQPNFKAEGICIQNETMSGINVLLVTDADDSTAPAELYACHLRLEDF